MSVSLDRSTAPDRAAGPGGTAPPWRPDAPSRTDPTVRGLSELIGGPLGGRAVHRNRVTTVAWLIIAIACLTLTLNWVQKSPCRDGAWQNLSQYKHFCYTDVLALYYAEGLDKGEVPYVDHKVEYPVLTGAFMGALGLPVHAYAKDHPGTNPGRDFYDLNALVLGALGVATAAVLVALRRRRPWDAAIFALSPILALTATVNWDLLAVALAALGVYAWARRRPVLAGVLLGLGTAAKLWPGFLFIPLVLLGLRARKLRAAVISGAVGVATWIAVNAPVFFTHRDAWNEFFRLNRTRGIDWGTFWYVGRHFPRGGNSYGIQPFLWLDQHVDPTLNWLTYFLFGVGCVGIALLVFLAPRRPRVGQLFFLVVAVFLLFSKVWSQQYVLWLLLPAILARPKWGALLAWQAMEVIYFVAFYGELMGASGREVFPEGVFVLASMLRWAAVAVLCGLVVRDILRPELDVVRRTYPDDPDGGAFDRAPDAPWLAGVPARPRELSGLLPARRWTEPDDPFAPPAWSPGASRVAAPADSPAAGATA